MILADIFRFELCFGEALNELWYIDSYNMKLLNIFLRRKAKPKHVPRDFFHLSRRVFFSLKHRFGRESSYDLQEEILTHRPHPLNKFMSDT